jgi:hypothetical protein
MDDRKHLFTTQNPPLDSPRLDEPSLADAMAGIAADKSIPDSRCRHWLTSMRSLATGIGRPPESLPCRLIALRHHINQINPAQWNWEAKTFSNHKANLKAAINHFMEAQNVPRRGAPLAAEWKTLFEAIPEQKPQRILSGLARFCSVRDILPSKITEELVTQYFRHREITTLQRVGVALEREVIKHWNECAEKVSGWPQRRLDLPDLPKKCLGAEWSEFPASLRNDIEAYLANLARRHLTAKGRWRRGSKASTVATRRRELEAFARTANSSGIPLESLTSLIAMLRPDVVRPTFEAYLDRSDGKPKGYAIDLAWKLHSIAKLVGAPADSVACLEEICLLWEEARPALITEKNMTVIRAVLMSDIWAKVCSLPGQLMSEARRKLNSSPRHAAILATVAVQIQILTRAPVRVSNLLAIKLGTNLKREMGRENSYRLHFPDYDVKNRVSLDFNLPGTTAAMIDDYINLFRPHLGDGHRGHWLFPGEAAKQRSSTHASASIAEMVEQRVGMRVTAHQFRHAAVAVIMKTHPGNIEMARQILGHINIETTMRFYTALESFRATEMFGAIIENELHKYPPPKPVRRPRRKTVEPSQPPKPNDRS